MKINMRKLWPYLVALGAIIIILLVLFYPALQGKTIQQEDVTSWRASSKEALDYYKATGEQAYWSGTMFSGMPVYQITIQHVGNLFLHVDKILTLFLPFFMGYVFLGFAGFYFMVQVLKMDKWASLAGSIAFVLSSYFIIILAVGHNSKAHAIAYMAPYLIAVYQTYRGKYLAGGLLAALILALELSCNHVQITYYLAFMVVILVLFEVAWAILDKAFKRFAIASVTLLVGLILAVGVNFSNLYTTYQYTKETIRGESELTAGKETDSKGLDKSYIYGWSYGVGETWSLMIPNVKGGVSQSIKVENKGLLDVVKDRQWRQTVGEWGQYWGEQPGISGPVYVGAIVVFFFILGLFIVRNRMFWPLLVSGVFGIMLSWGGNFRLLSDFFVDNLPLLDKFRAPSMWLVVAELVIPLIFVMTLHELITNYEKWSAKIKYLYISFGLTGGIALIFWLMPTMFFGFISEREMQVFDNYRAQGADVEGFISALTDVRIAIFKADALRSFLFILGGATAAFLLLKKKIKAPVFAVIIILLVAIDLIPVSKRYLKDSNFIAKRKVENPFTASPADEMIMKDNKDGARVLNLSVDIFNDATTSYFHRSAGGYHAAKLMKYQELIVNQLAPEISIMTENLRSATTMGRIDTVLSQSGVMNMLNTRYFILDPTQPPLVNRHACGHAWFVDSWRVVQNADEEIQAVGEINPSFEAVVDQRYSENLASLSAGTDSSDIIKRTVYTPNSIQFEAEVKAPRLAVFSEIWYPEWKLYIDGVEAPLLRANYVLRAAVIPAGKHQIEMKVIPAAFEMSTKVSYASSAILLLLAASYLFLAYRRHKVKTQG